MNITHSKTLTAFGDYVIGTKVLDPEGFLTELMDVLKDHNCSEDRVHGQHFIVMPESAFSTISPECAKRTDNLDDYVLGKWPDGRVDVFLKREKASKVVFLAVVVYTTEAYLRDPLAVGDKTEVQRIEESGATHVIIDIIASSGLQAPLTPYQFVTDLAGGSNGKTSYVISEMARSILMYWEDWCIVSD